MNGLELATNAVALWRKHHGNESLDQQCQRFTGYYESWAATGTERGIVVYPSAIAAARASDRNDVGGDINKAPIGSYVYWDIGSYGHVARVVGVDFANGRKLVSMASKRGKLIRQLPNDVRIVYADSYVAKYIGWAWTNGANKQIPLNAWNINVPVKPAKPAKPASIGTVFTPASKLKGAPYWPKGALMKRIQKALKKRGRYSGAADGVGGINTAKGIQKTLEKGAGYDGPIDGKLGPVAGRLVQEYAKKWGGYTGPIDGNPRENSWTAFAKGLEKR